MFKRKKPIKVYKSIDDMPVYNWFKVHETDQFSYLLIEPVKNIQDYYEELKEAWKVLYYEFIDVFGISDSHRRILELQRDISVLKAEQISYNDNSNITFIQIAELELKQLTNDVPNKNIDAMKVEIEKYMGFPIRVKEVTVKEYYTYLNSLISDSQKVKPNNG